MSETIARQQNVIGPDHLGLRLEVYRSALTGDCTMGASVRHDSIWVANDISLGWSSGAPPIFRDTGHVTRAEAERADDVLFQVRITGGRRNVIPIPKEGDTTHPWFMMGGNYAGCCDSRGPALPVPIHDRTEGSTGTCYPFYGVNDGPLDIGGFTDKRSYMAYLKALIADLRESNNHATADDFELCLIWMRRRL